MGLSDIADAERGTLTSKSRDGETAMCSSRAIYLYRVLCTPYMCIPSIAKGAWYMLSSGSIRWRLGQELDKIIHFVVN